MNGPIVGKGHPGELELFRVFDLKCSVCGFERRTFRHLQTGVALNGLSECPNCGGKLEFVKNAAASGAKPV